MKLAWKERNYIVILIQSLEEPVPDLVDWRRRLHGGGLGGSLAGIFGSSAAYSDEFPASNDGFVFTAFTEVCSWM